MRYLFILVLLLVPSIVQGEENHKGATFPTTKTFLPDCSLFIDPKDVEKFSHCEKIDTSYSSGKWHGFTEFTWKPGTTSNLGETDLFFPLAQDENDMTFFNTRGNVDFGESGGNYNIGLGHRHIFDEWILGAYGYYDNIQGDNDKKYSQLTFGIEALTETWDFRANGYIPEEKEETYTHKATVTMFRPADQIKVKVNGIYEEKALPGLDLEAGYKLPLSIGDPDKWHGLFDEVRVFAGGYLYMGGNRYESIAGPRVRLEASVNDIPYLGTGSSFVVGLESQYDDVRGNQTSGLLALKIPFGAGEIRTRPAMKGLDGRMMNSVIRDVSIVTQNKDRPLEVHGLYNANGNLITKAVDVKWDEVKNETIGDCEVLDTDCKMQASVEIALDELEEDGETGLVFVHGEEGKEETLMAWGNKQDINSNQILAGAGHELEMTFYNEILGKQRIGYTEAGTKVGTNGSGCWELGDNSQLNGWDINAEGCESGILINRGKSVITNSTIFNADNQNIKISDGSLYVDGLTLYGTNTGILISGTGKLRGVKDTDGTLGYSTDNTPEIEKTSYKNQVISFTNDVVFVDDKDLSQIDGVDINATGYNRGILVDHTGRDFMVTNSVIHDARSENINLRNGTLYVNELGLYGTKTGVLIFDSGKLRGVKDTDGTLGFTAATPRQICKPKASDWWVNTNPNNWYGYCYNDQVVHLQNADSIDVEDPIINRDDSKEDADTYIKTALSNIDNLSGAEAHISGVTINAGNYYNGVLASQNKKYFITDIKVYGGERNGYSDWGSIRLRNPNGTLYIRDSIISGETNGIAVNSGILVANRVFANNNGPDWGSGFDIRGADSYAIIANGSGSNNRVHGLNAVRGGTVFATGMSLNNNNYEGADSNEGGSYIYITDSTLSGNSVGFLINSRNSGKSPNEIYAERVTIANSKGPGAVNVSGKLTIKDSKITGSKNVGVSTRSTSGGHTKKESDIFNYYAYQLAETILENVEMTGGGSHSITNSGGSKTTLKRVTVRGNKGYGILSKGASYTYGILAEDGTLYDYKAAKHSAGIKNVGKLFSYTDATRATVDTYSTINIDSTSNIFGNVLGHYMEQDGFLGEQDTGDRDSDGDITEYFYTETRNDHFGQIFIKGVACDLMTENSNCQP